MTSQYPRPVTLGVVSQSSQKVPVSFRTLHATADKTILVDSGATDNFIHPKLLRRLGLGSRPLERPRKIWNIDGMMNKAGALTHCVNLEVRTGNRQEVMKFLVTDLGGEDLILGYPCVTKRHVDSYYTVMTHDSK